MKPLLQAYILHRRPFRDTSLLVDFFTLESGMISAVAKGAKRPKSKLRSAMQFFTPLLIDCYGRHELVGLKTAEVCGPSMLISGKHLLTLLYVNELLCRLLQKQEPHSIIYHAYEQLIMDFSHQAPIEPALRAFEMLVLQDLGYGLNLHIEAATGMEVIDHEHYHFILENGVQAISAIPSYKAQNKLQLTGKLLRDIQQQNFTEPQVLSAAKQLFRQIFTDLLHHKSLNSRQLFAYSKEKINEQ